MKRKKCPVSIRLRETPVPIPNTTVKPEAAEGTVLETARENRRMPDNIYFEILARFFHELSVLPLR